MKLGDSRGIKTNRWFTNEILDAEDINNVSLDAYKNLTDAYTLLAKSVLASESKDVVIAGLTIQVTTAMTCNVLSGAAISFKGSYFTGTVWGFSSGTGSFSAVLGTDTVLAFDVGGASDRIDAVSIKPVQSTYNQKTRAFKDPTTGLVTSTNMDTKIEYVGNLYVTKGTEGAGVAPSIPTGHIKIAEVYVAAGVSSLQQSNIVTYANSAAWTTDPLSTVPLLRVKHGEIDVLFTDDTPPKIKANSYLEISGYSVIFPIDTDIDGTAASAAINYIRIAQSKRAEWSTTAPKWYEDKNGWYDSTGAYRYIAYCYFDGSAYIDLTTLPEKKDIRKVDAVSSVTAGDFVFENTNNIFDVYNDMIGPDSSSLPFNIEDIAALDNETFVAVYRDSSTYYGYAVIGKVSNGSISWGTAVAFNSRNTGTLTVAKISSNSFVIGFRDDDSTYFNVTFIAGTVSDTTITFGSKVTATSTDTNTAYYDKTVKVANVGFSKFAAVYVELGDSYKGKAIAGSVSGNTITLGTAIIVTNDDTSDTGGVGQLFIGSAAEEQLNGKSFFKIGYMTNAGTSNAGYVYSASINGTTISLGAACQYLSSNSGPLTFVCFNKRFFLALNRYSTNPTKAFLAYEYGRPGYEYLSIGELFNYEGNASTGVAQVKVCKSRLPDDFVAVTSGSTSGGVRALKLISGTNLVLQQKGFFAYTSSTAPSTGYIADILDHLSKRTFIAVVWGDQTHVVRIPERAYVSMEDASSDSKTAVIISGQVLVANTLVPSRDYWLDASGNLVNIDGIVYVGKALTEHTLYIDGDKK